MTRYIDADAYLQKICTYNETGCGSCRFQTKCPADEPTIEAEPKHGKWIPCTKEGMPLTEYGRMMDEKWYGYKCSKCNFIYKGNALIECNFCQKCGADMRMNEC